MTSVSAKAGTLLVALCVWSTAAGAFEECGDLANHYGPFDYWTDKPKLGIVESYHFTPKVENLRSGESGRLGGDIDYTLRAFPNHPKALMAMIRLGQKERTTRPSGARYSVVCYLERAIRFRPEDAVARMVYGTYLAGQKKNKEAVEQLEEAEKLAGDNANLHYNLGLVYTDLGQYDRALRHAHQAYRQGFNLPGLRAKLQRAGKWQEPAVEPLPTSDGSEQGKTEGSTEGKSEPVVKGEGDGIDAVAPASNEPAPVSGALSSEAAK